MDIKHVEEMNQLLNEYRSLREFLQSLTAINSNYHMSIKGSYKEAKDTILIPSFLRECAKNVVVEAATAALIERQRRIEQL